MKMLKCWLTLAAILGLVFVSGNAFSAGQYDFGASDTEITIGNTLPYSGPASAYGTIGKCMSAYFEKLNKEEGGINGRKINFISLDDGYSPPKTKEQFRRLVEKDKVLAIVAPLGTPTNLAVVRYINKKEVPHLFLLTGASYFNDYKQYPWTMGFQPSYYTESEIYVNYLLEKKPDATIAILYENNDFGKDYLTGFEMALAAKGKSSNIIAKESYATTAPTIDSQVITLKASGADAFYSINTPKFAAQVISKVHDLEWKPEFFIISNTGANPSVFKAVGYEKSDGVISARYHMDPTDEQHLKTPGMIKWKKFMEEYYPEGSLIQSLNVLGYYEAQTIAELLRKCGDNLTRANVLKQAESFNKFESDVTIPGISITTSKTDHRPMESMQPIRFNGKKEAWEPLGDVVRAGNDLKQ